MNTSIDIGTLTLNPAVDKSSATPRVVPDKKLRCDPPRFEPGGGGINVARAVRRLGGEAVALYPAGGFAGKLFDDLLQAEGIPHHPIAIHGTTRVNLMVMETETGQQFRFTMPGPNLDPVECQTVLEALSGLNPFPRFFVLSGSFPPGVPTGFQKAIAHLATRHQSKLLVDSSSDSLRSALEEGVYLVKPNLRELRQLCGEHVQEEAQILAAAQHLVRSRQSQVVVVSLGRAGALFVSPSTSRWIRSPNVPVQSKVGAGDSMMAGLALALARGASELDAACFGVAAGAAAAMTPASELCRRDDTERLYEQVKKSMTSG